MIKKEPAKNRFTTPDNHAIKAIKVFQEKFPLAFPEKQRRPLALNIRKALLEKKAELNLSSREINQGLYYWCNGSKYYKSIDKLKFRVSLEGKRAEPITKEEKINATKNIKKCIKKKMDARLKPNNTNVNVSKPRTVEIVYKKKIIRPI